MSIFFGRLAPSGLFRRVKRRPTSAWLFACFLLMLGLAGLAASATRAQTAPGTPGQEPIATVETEDPYSAAAIASRLESVRSEIQRAKLAAESVQPHQREVMQLLQQIEVLLVAQSVRAASLTESPPVTAIEGVQSEPASVFALNRLYEALEDELRLREAQRELADSTANEVDAAKSALRAAESERRQAKARLERPDSDSSGRALREAFQLRTLESRAAMEVLRLREMEHREIRREGLSAQREEALRDEIRGLRRALASNPGSAVAVFAPLIEGEAALRRLLESSRRELSSVELRVKAAENQYATASSADANLLARVEALAAQRDTIRHQIALIDSMIEQAVAQAETWRDWDALLRGRVSSDELRRLAGEVEERIDLIDQNRLRLEVRLGGQQRAIEALQQRIDRLQPDSALRAAIAEQKVALEALREHESVALNGLLADARATARLAADLHVEQGDIDVLELARNIATGAKDFWSYEVTSVDDSSITIGSLLIASFLVGLGLWASRRGSAFVGRIAEQRFSLEPGASHALKNLSFYFLLVVFGLLALRAVHFPLTAFTVAGGALAIGVGFGSQNVMNNFISGLILMLERPVRARDLVEVDGNHGIIERIGARSTQIRSTDGRHIIVPNSFFLESNVVNWTLSDDLIRARVLVGVVYGSPTRLVESLIQRVVDEMQEILPQPPPIILFEEFGDNSLNFEVHFWVRARTPMATRKIASQVRFRIDDLFREHDIVIAFPQRDVHLNSVAPIDVRLVDGSDSSD